MKIKEALAVLGFGEVPDNEGAIKKKYRELAKSHHPDSGGSEHEFKRLQEAVQVVERAIILLKHRNTAQDEKERKLKEQRAKMREAMLKRRAVEDHKRNVQATGGIFAIGVIIVLVGLWFIIKPHFVHWMVEKNPIERMAIVQESGLNGTFVIGWDYDSQHIVERVSGREIDGKWVVGAAGMPMIRGGKYVVAFNASNPEYFELKDQFIHPETAEMYFDLVKHQMSANFGMKEDDPKLICLYWTVLNELGVDGISHMMFSTLPFRKNWQHNERSFEALKQSEAFDKILNSCVE